MPARLAVAERYVAVVQPEVCALTLRSGHLLPQVSGVPLGDYLEHPFEHHRRRGLAVCRLLHADDLDAAASEQALIDGAVFAVTGEAVELPYIDADESPRLRVCNHALELGALVGLRREAFISVFRGDLEAVALRCQLHVLKLEIERVSFYLFRRTDTGIQCGSARCVTHRLKLLFAGSLPATV
ncbi:MAG TPA: hypothetical protein VEZ14_07650 [Dehalococcoidia bacterium]|nr:hypothetical protein [Dehalococcoidia bacterium]